MISSPPISCRKGPARLALPPWRVILRACATAVSAKAAIRINRFNDLSTLTQTPAQRLLVSRTASPQREGRVDNAARAPGQGHSVAVVLVMVSIRGAATSGALALRTSCISSQDRKMAGAWIKEFHESALIAAWTAPCAAWTVFNER